MDPSVFPPTPDDLAETVPVKHIHPTKRKKIALWLTFGPTGALLASFWLYIAVAITYALSQGLDGTEELLANPPYVLKYLGDAIVVALFAIFIVGPPALAAGLYLLVTQRKYRETYKES